MTPRELKEWREQNGLSQAKLAKALGVDVMTVSRWERGAREIPSFLHLALLGHETIAKRGGEMGRQGVKSKKGGKA
jgi:transcriptional regulator with XRE-family HTH domain